MPADFDPVAEARRLLRTARSGALAAAEADGSPFVSLVNVATDVDGAPILLVSGLSRHTRLMAADPRVSLMLAQAGKGDPLAHPRLTLTGRVGPARDERARRRFLARHPKSALYADFPDFAFLRVAIGAGHLNGGFARAAELEPGHLLTPLEGAQALIDVEAEAIAHMNQDHPDAVALYAGLAKAGEGSWRVSGIDPDGVDLASGDKTARLAFPARATDAASLRRALAELAELARRKS
ncbi:MAG: HugZ family protein [Rhodoblastus sp.]|nr:MAG: HugZ family protein [Rhodoblastus sp.]